MTATFLERSISVVDGVEGAAAFNESQNSGGSQQLVPFSLRVAHNGKKFCYPPASEASREEANLTERKNLHTPVCGVKEFVCRSVCLSLTNFDPNYIRTG